MIFSRKQFKRVKILFLIAGLSFVLEFSMPHVSYAAYTPGVLAPQLLIDNTDNVLQRGEKMFADLDTEPGSLPLAGEPAVAYTHYVTVTAYSSEPRQTDATPYTTGWQTPVRDGIVALNFLPFGTVVRFPEIFGEREFVVEDRMNVRYPYRADIWMVETAAAKEFGLKYLKMEVLDIRLDRDFVLTKFEPAFPGRR